MDGEGKDGAEGENGRGRKRWQVGGEWKRKEKIAGSGRTEEEGNDGR